ncbi:hypothetical protein Vretifemale_17123, partial [Volvox reticuliferus]
GQRNSLKLRSPMVLADAFSGSSLYGSAAVVTGGGDGGAASGVGDGVMFKASSFSYGLPYGTGGGTAEDAVTEASSTPRTRPSALLPGRQSMLLRIGSSALSKVSLLTSGAAEIFVPDSGPSNIMGTSARVTGGGRPMPQQTASAAMAAAATSADLRFAYTGPAEDPAMGIAETGGCSITLAGGGGEGADAHNSRMVAAARAAAGSAATSRRWQLPSPSPPPSVVGSNLRPQAPVRECWHEVCATSVIDPMTGSLAVVLVQQDVTAKVVAERHVHQVAEVEHRLLEQIFPRHVLQYITEESVAPSGMQSSPGNIFSPGSLETVTSSHDLSFLPTHSPNPSLMPQMDIWRPQIRDCNRLATWHPKASHPCARCYQPAWSWLS